ncbi:MAG: SGNH/GDSL hydrolase family protein [Anaeromyxobacter sp.]
MMTLNLFVPSLALAVVAVVAVSGDAAAADIDDRLKQDLRAASRLRIFFGHQSVGANVLDGVSDLSRQAGVPLTVAQVDSAGGIAQAGLAHALVGGNGDPRSKLAAFERALEGAQVDVALVKFCYIDVDEKTDVAALFAEYQATLARLRARHPRTRFVHVTVPLKADQGWMKTSLKQLLGRGAGSVIENVQRERYNALLRDAYREEPIFDLARSESTRPDGSRELLQRDGKPVPMLVPAYTDDSSHLNVEGRQRAARDLLTLLGALSPAAP